MTRGKVNVQRADFADEAKNTNDRTRRLEERLGVQRLATASSSDQMPLGHPRLSSVCFSRLQHDCVADQAATDNCDTLVIRCNAEVVNDVRDSGNKVLRGSGLDVEFSDNGGAAVAVLPFFDEEGLAVVPPFQEE